MGPAQNKKNMSKPTDNSTSARASYHHGDLRQALLDAACAHLRVDNADTLSLRALAREIGVSQTAPYRHFDSRNALFAGIATLGFQILHGQMNQALADPSMPADEAMIELGATYLSFSQTHYEKYQLFFDSSMVDFDEYPDLQQASAGCFDILLGVIRKGQAEGVFRDGPETDLAAIAWSTLHGIASLMRLNRQQQTFLERPVGQAIAYLGAETREVLGWMVASLRR